MDKSIMQQKPNYRTVLLLLILVVSCFAGNYFAPELPIGTCYLFGSIPLLLTVCIFGLRWGMVAGLAAAAATWDRPELNYTTLVYIAEPACVGWLIAKSRNRNIILSDAAFWPFAGVPLLYIQLHFILHMPLEAAMAKSLTFWIMGITNAVIASLLLTYIPFRNILGSTDEINTVPIHHLIFNLMMTAVLLPTIVVMIPFGSFKTILLENGLESLLVLLGLNMLALVTALYTSHRLAEPLRKLSNITTDLPERLMQGKIPPWPDSRIAEIDRLCFNFRTMATALSYKFQEITYYSESLETRVRERTKELTKINEELKKEIRERIATEKQRDHLLMQLRQKNEELEGIVYVASHDLRSPLVNVQGFSRKLVNSCEELEKLATQLQLEPEIQQRLDKILNTSIPKSLKFITSSTEKMGMLLNGLLRLSRLGHASLCFDRLDMNSIMENIVTSMTYQIDTVKGTIELGDLTPCLADAGQVTQVFSNLLDNAIKFRSPERPLHIRVLCEEQENGICYHVEDNGMGIPHNHLDRIWEIFHRLNPNDTPGDGLGLTLARQIISRLDGSIRVESEFSAGTSFYVLLPKAISAN